MQTIQQPSRRCLNDYVEAFESSREEGGSSDLSEFLPEPSDPLYPSVFRELVRVDMEYHFDLGCPKRIDDYLRDFPGGFGDHEILRELAFEEYRLRVQAGDAPRAEEYQQRFGVCVEHWPGANSTHVGERNLLSHDNPSHTLDLGRQFSPAPRISRRPNIHTLLDAIAREAQRTKCPSPAEVNSDGPPQSHDYALDSPADAGRLGSWSDPPRLDVPADQVASPSPRLDPDSDAAILIARAAVSLPMIGSDFLNFRLISELGRGAFARVYLAEQTELANRRVALKVSTDIQAESQSLARLEHENIVPILSVHSADPFQAICMPFRGSYTLASVLEELAPPRAKQRHRRGIHLGSRENQPRSFKTTATGEAPPSTQEPLRASRDKRASGTGSSPVAASPSEAAETAVDPSNISLEAEPSTSIPQDVLNSWDPRVSVNSVLRMMLPLAHALAHAHDQGILHQDLKPANILISDKDQQPHLLDFNLSRDLRRISSPTAARVGGTLPYMAPEQLEAMLAGRRQVQSRADTRGDLYSFGVILYQVLTRGLPFPIRTGSPGRVLRAMLADRKPGPPPMRGADLPVRLPPGVVAILRKCLEPELGQRYQSARDLHEDLLRHLQSQPLKHAANTSPTERLTKWVRRNQVAVVAGVLLLGMVFTGAVQSAIASQRASRLAEYEALENLDLVKNQAGSLRYALWGAGEIDPQSRQDAIERASSLIEATLPPSGPAHWGSSPLAIALPSEENREQLRATLHDLSFLVAWALSDANHARLDSQPTLAMLAESQRWIHYASVLSDHPGAQPALDVLSLKVSRQGLVKSQTRLGAYKDVLDPSRWKARRVMNAGVGGPILCLMLEELRVPEDRQIQSFLARTANDEIASVQDLQIRAAILRDLGQLRQAVATLARATTLEPRNPELWFSLGTCQASLEQHGEAVRSFDTCIAMGTDHPLVWFYRGLSRLKQNQVQRAFEDFTVVMRMQPAFARAWINRATALSTLGRHDEALSDLQTALDLGHDAAFVHLKRAFVLRAKGDAAASREARELGLASTPKVIEGWNARAYALMASNPTEALAAVEHALTIDPFDPATLMVKSHVLSERLGQVNAAIETLDLLLTVHPDHVGGTAGRGVLLARLGQRDAAIADARRALAFDRTPMNRYQIACIYALTAVRNHPEDQKLAIGLVAAAVYENPQLVSLARDDSDLASLRGAPGFRELLDAAETVKNKAR